MSNEDKEELLDKTIDAYHQSTGNLPDEDAAQTIFTLVNDYEDQQSDE